MSVQKRPVLAEQLQFVDREVQVQRDGLEGGVIGARQARVPHRGRRGRRHLDSVGDVLVDDGGGVRPVQRLLIALQHLTNGSALVGSLGQGRRG